MKLHKYLKRLTKILFNVKDFSDWGAGYVGSVLVPKLINNGYDVRTLDLMLFGSQGLDSVKDKHEIIKGDIRDINCLEKSLEDIDAVIHLAAISNDPCSDLNPELTRQVNFYATQDLIDLSKNAGVKRFIYASSSSVYGLKKEENVTENLPLKPLTIYSETKALSEEIVKKNNSEEFTTVSIRPATVCGYSPRMRLDVIVNILASAAILNKNIIVNGGDQFRSNLHINDMTNLYVDLLSVPKEKIGGEIFNCGGENCTVLEIAKTIKKSLGGDVGIEIRPPTQDSRSYRISSEKLRQELGIFSQKTIRDAVLDIKNAFENGLIINPKDTNYRNVAKMKELNIV